MLKGAWNLEHLSLKMDKASIEDSWPHLEEPEELWMYDVAQAQYWNLQSLALTGFPFDKESLHKFVAHHKQSLRKIHFDNCDLDAPWGPIFDILRTAPYLEKLLLHQISQLMTRIAWIEKDEVLWVEEVVPDDWVYVMHGYQHRFTLDAHATAAEWDALSNTLRLSRREACPFMEDALSWHPEFLI